MKNDIYKKICIDAGHCDKFAGAQYKNGSQKEEQDNLRMALAVEKHLKSFGHKVFMTRTDGKYLDPRNKDVDLNARPIYANSVGADYFISIHRNSLNSTSTGTEAWVYSKADANTVNIAQSILNEIYDVAPVKKRGVKKGYTNNPFGNYAVNRLSNMPSCLLELLFISNPEDNAIYNKYFEQYAKAIAVGLCKGLGCNSVPKVVETPKPVNPVSPKYRLRIQTFEGEKLIAIGNAIVELFRAKGSHTDGMKEYEKGKYRVDVYSFTSKEELEKAQDFKEALHLLGIYSEIQKM